MKNGAGSVSKYTTKSGERLWRYRFDADPIGGKRNVVSKQGFSTRGAATNALHEATKEYRERKATSVAVLKTEPTVGEWLRTWLDTYAERRCQPKTLERYEQLARYILNSPEACAASLASTPLIKATHGVIETTLYALLKAKGQRREHLSARTIRHVAGVLSVALNKAFQLELIPINPMLKVELPRVERKQARSLTPEEIATVRGACRGDWTFALIEVAIASGARRGELLALTWTDIDWISGRVTISKSLEQTKNGLRVKMPKSNKTRSFSLPQSALAALSFLREHQAEHKRLFGPDYQERDVVFCAPDGRFLAPDLVSQTVIRRLRKAGITNASIHTLRHTHASNLLSRGVPLPAVSSRLGHADPNITARVYSHALPADDRRAADIWDVLISGPGKAN